ncbi:MAG: gamma-glutamyltransferase [Deltaproteobacteria bacterium]|nr:gamma-glutamyltransferase [Deltaproteobacteria bacterium]
MATNRKLLTRATVASGTVLLTLAPLAHGWYSAPFTAQTHAVATDNSDASRAALTVLEAGGNAADAAIAAALALGVVSPSSSGFGGGGFAVICPPTGGETNCKFVDFREVAPQSLTVERMRASTAPRASQVGGLSVGVPGEPAGFVMMSQRFGRRPLAVATAPAVRLAREGFVVSPFLLDRLGQEREEIANNPAFSAAFGESVRNARMRRPRLAQALERYGREGERFVHGALANAIAETVSRAGGVLTADDVRAYRPIERRPLSRNVFGHTVVTASAPSAGGMIVLQTLTQLEALSSRLGIAPPGSSAAFHVLADGWRQSFDDRSRYVGDPGASDDTVSEALLAPARLRRRHESFSPSNARATVVISPANDQGTSHLCVIDRDGMAVSLTTTVNLAFGSRVVIPAMDILLNDQIDDFSIGTSGNNFGLAIAAPNALQPGRRPVSSMSPSVVLRDGRPVACVGASGGPRIATATTQVIANLLLHRMNVEAAVAAPRAHHQGAPDVLLLEPEVPEDVRVGLLARGYTVRTSDSPLAAATAIAVEGTGPTRRLFASSDPRKAGGAPAGR